MELLRTLDAVAEQGTLTRAASFLRVTQPAITSQIKRLQEILRVPIFSRESGARGLTPEAAKLLPVVRRILALNDQLLLETRGSNSKSAISVGLAMFYSCAYLTKFLEVLKESHPALDVQIETASSADLKPGIQNLVYDLVVKVGEAPERYVAVHEWPEPVGWVAAHDFVASPTKPVPVISMPKNNAQGMGLRLLTQGGGTYSVPIIAHDWHSLLSALRAGRGVAVLPLRYLQPDLRVLRTSFLPDVPDHRVGIYVSDQSQSDTLVELANVLHRLAFPLPQPKRAGGAA
jgi:DNA-binding transcriptional LysR family regulator